MRLTDKLYHLKCFRIIEDEKEISKDNAKYILMCSRLLNNLVNTWPEDTSCNIYHTLVLMMCFLHLITIIVSFTVDTEDADSFVAKLFLIEASIQVTYKYAALIYKSNDLAELIKTVRIDFWPSNIGSLNCDRRISEGSKFLFVIAMIEHTSGFICTLMTVLIPFMKSTKELPYASWFPFDWTKSPYYQILFFLQALFTTYLGMNMISAYDTLYYSFCVNCTAQFKLLCDIIERIGSNTEDEIIGKLLKIPGVIDERRSERKFLLACSRHHQKLIAISNDLNRVFGNGHLVQIICGAAGICAACYRITIDYNFKNLVNCLSFYLGNAGQIFIYCAVSNELSYWSSCVSTATYKSLWYKINMVDTKKCLSIVMLRSQKPISMQAIGLFELNYPFFVTVMRFTFSLYTFLGTMGTK